MASVQEHLNKMREERIAREKARIDKLREINLKKYNKNEPQLAPKLSVSTVSVASKLSKPDIKKSNVINVVKNNFHVNGTTKRPITAPLNTNKKSDLNKKSDTNKDLNKTNSKPKLTGNVKVDAIITNAAKKAENNTKDTAKNVTVASHIVSTDKTVLNTVKIDAKIDKNVANSANAAKTVANTVKTSANADKHVSNMNKNDRGDVRNLTNGNRTMNAATKEPKMIRKSFAPNPKPFIPKTKLDTRKSMQPQFLSQSTTKVNPNRQSVFERLYQPKIVPKKTTNDVQKIQTDPNYLKKVIKNSGLILNKRHTLFEPKKTSEHPVRRSISAVHFKRISKHEINNCIHKWSSIGDKLDKVHLQEVSEDASVKEDKIISAVKSERKKVKFQTPVPHNYNTPRPEELRSRLQNWLQKHGKSIDSYHHLQCFGIHHLTQKLKPLIFEEPARLDQFDDENKENEPLESDSDNESFTDNMNERQDEINEIEKDRWRRASFVSDSVDLNETQDSTMTTEAVHHIDELLLGALNDLTELLREGFDWEQCARWLRAIRERFPRAPEWAAYWECRAALEETRGDLPASVQCWEEAIAKGTEHSVVEANLDQLLDKFMQLKISPNSGRKKQPDPKMVDIKNVFKSTLIRFAVQQAKLRQSNQSEAPKYTVTPVRRSGRISAHWSGKRTPLRVCTTVRQAGLLGHPVVFVPNDKLCETP